MDYGRGQKENTHCSHLLFNHDLKTVHWRKDRPFTHWERGGGLTSHPMHDLGVRLQTVKLLEEETEEAFQMEGWRS